MDFLQTLLPSEGLVCVAVPRPLPKKGLYQRFFSTIQAAQEYATARDNAGDTVFVAQATFKTDECRRQTNALSLKNFFIDIDCGEKYPYKTKEAGGKALIEFVKKTGLPKPSVVSSGNGLYAHWVLTAAIPAQQWQNAARVLKQLTHALDFKVDQTRTADSASILRPLGSTHRKDPTNPKKVVLVKHNPETSFDTFFEFLMAAAKKHKIEQSVTVKAPEFGIDDEFSVYDTNVADLHKIAEKCNQVGYVRTSKGDVEEPEWYAFIGLARHCADSHDLIHEWSSGHPDYTVGDTDAKIKQHEDSGVGPTTCAHFTAQNPNRCAGCKFANKVKSPIILGSPMPEKVEIASEEVAPPKGFMRTKEGLVILEEESIPVVFYDADLYPISLQYDQALECETVTFKHHMKHEGWKEFTIKSSIIPERKALITALWANHVKIVGDKGKKLMGYYVEGYMKELQNHQRLSHLCSQMGWREDRDSLAFVHGKTLFHKDHSPTAVNFSSTVPTAAKGYRVEGEMAPWVELTEVLNHPDFTQYAFALCAGAFGAPLMRFTGYEGAMLALVGKTGHGKTIMQRWIQSVYGYHKDLMMYKEDTGNALVSRLGLYGSLPLTIDEITNIDPLTLSDLAYRVTQGRDKVRLTQSAKEKTNTNQWNTLAVVSSNSSLMDKLATAKADASAEINRVFEFPIIRPAGFDEEVGARIFNTIDTNFGHVGQAYIQELVKNQDKHKANILAVAAEVNKTANCTPEERFWSAVAAVTIYGGMVARRAGLVKFDITPLFPFAATAINTMRGDKVFMVRDAVTILGEYLAETLPNTLIVTDTVSKRRGDGVSVVLEPRGALRNRLEADAKILYVSVSCFREHAARKLINMGEIRHELAGMGAFMPYRASQKKTLGSGTIYSGVQQNCWALDLTNPALGAEVMQVVKNRQALMAQENSTEEEFGTVTRIH